MGRRILRQPLSAQEKQDACIAVLRRHINRKALSRAWHRNPALRFCADMLLLQADLQPYGQLDDLCELAVSPAHFLAQDWIMENQFHQRPDGVWHHWVPHAEEKFARLCGASRVLSVTKN